MSSPNDIRPFSISVSNEMLDEISAKLAIARLPEELDLPEDQKWDWGIPLDVVRPALDYWRTQYDWRAVEAKLNQTLPQFTTHVESLGHGQQELHFVHKRSRNPNATPLIFIHGWPGNFLEVSKIIDELTDPKNPSDHSFHVVAPSLPGYVFSQRASTPGMEGKATAFVFDGLMAKLGYKQYLAQGGDWGAFVCRALAVHHQGTCVGTHTNMPIAGPPSFFKSPLALIRTILGFMSIPGGISAEAVKGLKDVQEFQKSGTGYSKLQGTRPQTLAVGLTDSPIGLLAWIGEKLHVWTDNYPWSPEELITWTMLYWINGPAGGLRYYKENRIIERSSGAVLKDDFLYTWSPTPCGFSQFPKELYRIPLEWCGAMQPVVFAKSHDRGGHFAAWEVPDLLIGDIRAFADAVASKPGASSTNSSSAPKFILAAIAIAGAAFAVSRSSPALFKA